MPYCQQRCHFDYRWWIEYGGGQVTDWGIHHTDIAMWALGLEDTGPYEIAGVGDFPEVENGFSNAVSFDCTMKFAGDKSVRLYSGTNELIISGELGRIRVNRGGLAGKPIEELTEQDHERTHEQILELRHGKRSGNHMMNFFDCIKDGGQPVSDVWSHHRSMSVCHLANLAMRLNRPLQWDPVQEDFVGDEEASALRSRPQREPYVLDV